MGNSHESTGYAPTPTFSPGEYLTQRSVLMEASDPIEGLSPTSCKQRGHLHLDLENGSKIHLQESSSPKEKQFAYETELAAPAASDDRPKPVPKPVTTQPRIKFLNGLRGLAALLVTQVHAGLFKGTSVAPSSVDVFFVLSAFLLTMLNEAKFRKLKQSNARPREWICTLADYFVKRILRVYPLFAATVIVLTIMPMEKRIQYYDLAHYHLTEWNMWELLTFKKRYFVLWTMPIEITYYFIIPVYVAAMGLLGKFRWAAVAALYVWVVYEGAKANRKGHDHFRPHVSTFLVGSLASTVYGGLSRLITRRTFEFQHWQLLVVRLIEGAMIMSILSDVFNGLFARWFQTSLFPAFNPKQPVVSLPASIVVIAEILAPSAIARAFEWNVLCYAGKISFSMYLLHPFINYQPWILALPFYDQMIVRLLLIFVLATASFHIVEYPCQQLAATIGKWLMQRSKPPSYHQQV